MESVKANIKPNPVGLRYGREPVSRLSRWSKRCGILLWMVAIAAVAWDKWGIWIRLRAGVVYQRHALLSVVEAADRIVLQSESSDLPLFAASPEYRESRTDLHIPKFNPEIDQVSKAYMFVGLSSRIDRYLAATNLAGIYETIREPAPPHDRSLSDWEWQDSSSAPKDAVPAYVGVLTSASGHRRLVIVSVDWFGMNRIASFEADVYQTTSFGGDRIVINHAPAIGVTLRGPWIRVFAGQALSDSAKVSFRYAVPEGEGHVEATLKDDDNVLYSIVDGPLKATGQE